MTDEERTEETPKLGEENEDVEAHRRRFANDEASDDESDESDDVEAHRRRA